MTEALLPPAVPDGYLRVAVAQLDAHAAARLGGADLLEHPLGEPDAPFLGGTDLVKAAPHEVRQLRGRVRAAYVHQATRRLVALVETARSWGVQVLVLPEYTVPLEALPDLLPATEGMVLVAGSHGVVPKNLAVYDALGVARPTPGTNVAPVLQNGRILKLVGKHHLAKPETDGGVQEAEATEEDRRVDLEALPIARMAVRMCMDYLQLPPQDGGADVQLVAVPALSNQASIDFDFHKLLVEAARLQHVVAFANVTSGGGTGVFVPTKTEQAGLQPNEEGLLVVDVDPPVSGKLPPGVGARGAPRQPREPRSGASREDTKGQSRRRRACGQCGQLRSERQRGSRCPSGCGQVGGRSPESCPRCLWAAVGGRWREAPGRPAAVHGRRQARHCPQALAAPQRTTRGHKERNACHRSTVRRRAFAWSSAW